VYHPGVDKIYLIGGFGGGQTIFSNLVMFDPASERVEELTQLALPTGLFAVGAAYSQLTGKIYTFGGRGAGSGNQHTDAIFEINIRPNGRSGTITPLSTKLPLKHSHMSAVEDPFTGLLYVVGGLTPTPEVNELVRGVRAFDPATGEIWTTLHTMRGFLTGMQLVFSVPSRHILVLGGSRSGLSSSEVTEDQKRIRRILIGDGPAVPIGRWDFPAPAASSVTAIDGDDRKVVIGTASSGAYAHRAGEPLLHYTPAMLGSASGRVNDVSFNSPGNRVWLATEDAGLKLDPGDGSLQTFGANVLGGNRILSVFASPGAFNDPRASVYAGPAQLGLRSGHPNGSAPTNPSFPLTNFAGLSITDVKERTTRDIWVLANNTLRRLEVAVLGANKETNFGTRCGATFIPRRLAFGINGDWWLVSDASDELVASGVCRILAAATPGVENFFVPDVGERTTDVDVDADGRVWIGVLSDLGETGGLAVYEVNKANVLRTSEFNWLNAPIGGFTLTPFTNVLWDSSITAVGAADERVWMGKSDGRLITLAQRWQQIDESNDLDQKVIQRLWTVRGRAFLAGENALHILQPDGQTWENRSDVRVHAVFGDSRGRIWVGTETDVRLYTPAGWDLLEDAPGRNPVGPILALAEDDRGRIWIGGADGVTLFDRGRFVGTFNGPNSPLPDGPVRALLADRDGRLWVGTDNGLARLDGSEWTVFTTGNGLPDNRIVDLAQLGTGEVAISTANGLSLYNGTAFQTQTLPIVAANLPLAIDELGRLWAGKALRNGNQWQAYYTTNSGMRSGFVSDIAADGADRIWFSHAPDAGVSVRGAFLPPLANTVPTISGIQPAQGKQRDIITITGSGFGTNPDAVTVTIGRAVALIESITNTEIKVKLGPRISSGDVTVRVDGRHARLQDAFCAEPVIFDVEPLGGNVGLPVTITGANFDEGAQISLGGPLRSPRRVTDDKDNMHFETTILPTDGGGKVQVINECGLTDDSVSDLHRIDLTLEEIQVSQGIQGVRMVADRPTAVLSYLSHSEPLRSFDSVGVDQVEFIFTQGNTVVTETVAYTGATKTLDGPPSEANLKEMADSVAVRVTPKIPGSDNQNTQVRVRLYQGGHFLTEGSTEVRFHRNLPLRVLLVPIMADNYTYQEYVDMQVDVNSDLDELRNRIWPTGDVDIIWYPQQYKLSQVLPGKSEVDIEAVLDLFRASDTLDRARRHWNGFAEERRAHVVFGVVQERIWDGEDSSGYAFWGDTSAWANLLLLNKIDTLCDVGNGIIRVISFGTIGAENGCHLDIPLFFGWIRAGHSDTSHLLAHEIGHTMGLVGPTDPNGDFTDNPSHSINDEVDVEKCNNTTTPSSAFNLNKTLYRQHNVKEPIVNPLLMVQWYPLDDTTRYDHMSRRAKATMSYACNIDDNNSYFEPVDISAIMQGFAMASSRFFVELASGPTALSESLAATETEEASEDPRPIAVPGPRLYVSGVVDKAANTGDIQHVEALGESAALDASYRTGYWLVQIDAAGNELARTGVFAIFAASDQGGDGRGAHEGNLGLFAASLLRQPHLARIELRRGDPETGETVLDSFASGSTAPQVAIASPTGGSFANEVPVAWTATDANGDALDIIILYSADGGATYLPVATASGSGTVNVPVAQLGGSNNARIQIVASDGFTRTAAVSAPFSVTAQPPRPFITHPSTGASFQEGDQIVLTGGAEDNQDVTVVPANLRWRSDRDGELGNGDELSVFLSVGEHLLTLEAANSAGLTATTSITLAVTGDYDMDGLTDGEEFGEGFNPLTERDAFGDADGDGLSLVSERNRDLDPNNADSDGDGRNDGQEVGEGTNAGVADQPFAPDQLSATPAALAFVADLSQDVPLPQEQVMVLSREQTDWTLTADVEWLAASRATGATPEGVTILADAQELGDGVHTGTLVFASQALNSSVEVPVTLTVTNSADFFDFDGNGINVGDVQSVAGRAPSDNSQESFDYRYDVDRDGDIDGDDGSQMAARWQADHACCPSGVLTGTAGLRVTTPATATVGSVFSVTVHLDNVADLGGFEAKLAFNPGVLQVESVVLGGLLGSGGRTAAPLGPILDNSAGRVILGGYSLGSSELPGAAASGSGVAAQISFRAVAPGNAGLALPAHLLADSVGAMAAAAVQVGALTVQPDGSTPPLTVYYISTESSGSVAGITFKDEDVLAYDTQTGGWTVLIDGSDIGLGDADIKALHWRPDQTILLSFGSTVTLPGLAAPVDDSDIVRFIPTSLGANTAGSYELYLDGSTVGLTTDNEDIDAIAFNAAGELVVSTVGTANVPGAAGAIMVREEDLMALRNGVWELLFDGSDIGLTTDAEDIKAVELNTEGLHLSTDGAYTINGLSGDSLDVFACQPLALGEQSQVAGCTVRLDGTALGLSGDAVDAFAVGRSGVQGTAHSDDDPSDHDEEPDEADEEPIDDEAGILFLPVVANTIENGPATVAAEPTKLYLPVITGD
jgi:hypothetical protein